MCRPHYSAALVIVNWRYSPKKDCKSWPSSDNKMNSSGASTIRFTLIKLIISKCGFLIKRLNKIIHILRWETRDVKRLWIMLTTLMIQSLQSGMLRHICYRKIYLTLTTDETIKNYYNVFCFYKTCIAFHNSTTICN